MSENEEWAFFAGVQENNRVLNEINPTQAERVRDFYRRQGIMQAAKRIKDQICFDALADPDHRCDHHGGKCYELWNLYTELTKEPK